MKERGWAMVAFRVAKGVTFLSPVADLPQARGATRATLCR